jgi:hypothetical protein
MQQGDFAHEFRRPGAPASCANLLRRAKFSPMTSRFCRAFEG